MAFKIIEGFDRFNGTGVHPGLLSKWRWVGDSTNNLALVAGRFGGQALRMGNSTGAKGIHAIDVSAIGAFACGFAFKYDNLGGAALSGGTGNSLIQFQDGATNQLMVTLAADGHLRLYRNTTLLASSVAGIVITDAWHYIEIVGTIADTGGIAQVYVDGALVIDFIGDTKNTANAYFNTLYLLCPDGSGSAGISNHDDFYLTDTAVRVGERRVETIYPNADTAQKNFTPDTGATNFSRVNEVPASVADYVQSSVSNHLDLYDLGNLSDVPLAIDAVQVSALALKTDAGSRQLSLVTDLGGTQVESAASSLSQTGRNVGTILEAKPGGGAWAGADVSGLRVGPKVAA